MGWPAWLSLQWPLIRKKRQLGVLRAGEVGSWENQQTEPSRVQWREHAARVGLEPHSAEKAACWYKLESKVESRQLWKHLTAFPTLFTEALLCSQPHSPGEAAALWDFWEILRGLRKKCIWAWAPGTNRVPSPSPSAQAPEAHGEDLPSLSPTGSGQRREGA